MRKTIISEEERQAIQKEFDGIIGIRELCRKYKHDSKIIRRIWLELYTEDDIKKRGNRLCSYNKLGDKNPMFGKFGKLHPSSVPITYTQEYRVVFAPNWFTGKADGGRTYEHIVVYCAVNNITELPPYHVIHHKDCDKQNNTPSNLELLSIGQHMAKHAWIKRRLKSATTIPSGSTHQEVVETGDDS